MTQPKGDELVTTENDMLGAGEAARRIGVSREYLRQLADSNRVQFETTPYGRVYDPSDIERVRLERKAKLEN
jgi:DNA-binding transcriptional MerR regulator